MDLLFGHLASRFSTQRENLATEALAFILNRSVAMRETFRRLVGRSGIELPQLARFHSQAGDEQGNIPDLIGLDAAGTERLVVENKFWAGLTENQPVGYLERLPAEGGAVLMFVVPSKRLSIVWAELASAAKNRERILPDPERPSADHLFARLSSTTALAATTWKAVLDSLEAAARASDETSSAADIAQLRSLCEVMDNEAFLPVSMEELINLEIPRRLIGLADLIPELADRAAALGIATTTGLLPTHGWYSSGRYLLIDPGIEAWMGIDYRYWSRYGITPLWIRFRNTKLGRAPFVLEALKAWPHVFDADGWAIVPLTVLPNVARDRVLEDFLEQLKKLNAALQAAAAGTSPALSATASTVTTGHQK